MDFEDSAPYRDFTYFAAWCRARRAPRAFAIASLAPLATAAAYVCGAR
ncbi:hypothetical protein [Streptomyces sp. NPDC055506]